MMFLLQTIVLLILSNIFMTFAWYGHLRHINDKSFFIVVIGSWSIAFFEYLFQIPANRIGYFQGKLTLAQLKIMQEAITLSVFVLFALLYMRQEWTWNYLWAALCLVAAVFFIFK